MILTLLTIYLAGVIVIGVEGIFLGLYLRSKGRYDSLTKRRVLRGCLWVLTGIVMLVLLRTAVITDWTTVLLSTGGSLILIELALARIEKNRTKNLKSST